MRDRCTLAGVLAGIIAGFIFGLSQLEHPDKGGIGAVLLIALFEALLAWVVLIMVFGAWAHRRLSDIVLPALANAVLVSVATCLILDRIRVPAVGFFVGAIVGLAIGKALCRACKGMSS